jgi:GTPase SAR1 family protein
MSEFEIEVMPAENKPHDKKLDEIPEFLPKLPATILILGQCGSGKSSCLWSLMTKGFVYGKQKKSVFHELIVYLGTLDARSCFEKMPVENQLILTEFDPVAFDEYQDDLKAHQLERLEKGKPMMQTCIIFDDMFGANLMKKSKVGDASPLEKLTLTSRHESAATIFYCAQAYKNSGFSSPAVRANITTIILYKMARNEVRKIAEEYAENYEVDEFIDHYDRIIAKKPYNFLVWDRRRPINADRWTEGFTTPMPPSRKLVQYSNLPVG